jgi:1-deoxy-D-xylulose-5-phosphate reductoisomerase
MKLPIQYALGFPRRIQSDFKRFDITSNVSLTFEKPDTITFRNLALAQEALSRGGNLPCILNAANEVAVDAFLQSRVGFLEMSEMIEDCMQKISFIHNPTLEDYMITDGETRKRATELLPA